MKLIKKGPKPKPWKGECEDCHNKYSALEKELKIVSDRDGSFAEKPCPSCKGRVFFYPPRRSGWGNDGDGSFGPRSVDC